MFQRIFATALGAGLGVGLLIAALQHVTLVPLILKAETYENNAAKQHKHAQLVPHAIGQAVGDAAKILPEFIRPAQAHEHNAAAAAAGNEDSGWRAVLTWITTTLTSVGFALLLAGAFAVSGRAIDAREGLLWGLGGFVVFALAPAFGLPPELPGSVAGDLVSRQVWWVATVAATAAGLGLMVFVRAGWAIAVGIALIAAPHVVGAPPPGEGSGLVPPELAAAFVARSLGVNAVFWALLGLSTGALYARIARAAPA
jgi:cobalt transporter subunit CbtA